MMEHQNLFGFDPFVGDDGFEIITLFVGNKQIQLNRASENQGNALTNQQETKSAIHFWGFHKVSNQDHLLSIRFQRFLSWIMCLSSAKRSKGRRG